MLNRSWTEEALGIAISGGADFAELFFEISRSGGITLLDGSIDKISDGTLSQEGEPVLDYLNDLKNVIGLVLLQYGCAIAGIALFCHFVFAKKYKVSFAKELTIPRYEVAHVTLANPGVIIFIVFTISQFVISIL